MDTKPNYFPINHTVVLSVSIKGGGVMDKISEINGVVNDFVWGLPTILMILGVGLFLTIALKGIQFRKPCPRKDGKARLVTATSPLSRQL